MLLDVALDEEGLLGGIEEARKGAFLGFSFDPVFRVEVEELLSFDDEDGGSVFKGEGGGFKRVEEGGGVFETGLELVPVGKEDVFAVGFQGVEFDGDDGDFFFRLSVEFVDVSGGGCIGLEDVGGCVVDPWGKEVVDDFPKGGSDMQGRGADEEDLFFRDFSVC